MEHKTVIQSTKWSAITELLAKIMTPLTNIILARLLLPEVFGVIATLTMVITFAEVFTDAGFQKYLVQHEFVNDTEKEQCTNVAFWSNFVFSWLLWLMIFVFRDQIAQLAGSEGYGKEVAVLSLQIPLVAFSSIQLALFRRDFMFKQLLPIRIVVSLVPLLVTVPLAVFLRNPWALVIGNLSREALNALLLTAKSKWKPRFYYSFTQLKGMMANSMWMMGDSLMIWITSYVDTFIVSRYLDSHHVGLYKTGITTVYPYISLIYTMTAPVLFSSLSRLQKQMDESKRVLFNFQKYTAYVVLPIGVGVFIYRDLATMILLGKNWMSIADLLGMVSFFLAINIFIAQYNSDFFRAMGKPHIALIVQAAYAVVLITSLTLAASRSFETLCLVRGCIGFVYAAISTVAICLAFKISVLKTIKNLLPMIIASGVMGVIGWLLNNLFAPNVLLQFVSVFLCMLVYAVVLLAIPISRKEILSILTQIKKSV